MGPTIRVAFWPLSKTWSFKKCRANLEDHFDPLECTNNAQFDVRVVGIGLVVEKVCLIFSKSQLVDLTGLKTAGPNEQFDI